MIHLLLGLALLAPADTPIDPIPEAEVSTAIDGAWGTNVCQALHDTNEGVIEWLGTDQPEMAAQLGEALITMIIDTYEEQADGTDPTGLADVGDRALTPEAERRLKMFLAMCLVGIDGR